MYIAKQWPWPVQDKNIVWKWKIRKTEECIKFKLIQIVLVTVKFREHFFEIYNGNVWQTVGKVLFLGQTIDFMFFSKHSIDASNILEQKYVTISGEVLYLSQTIKP